MSLYSEWVSIAQSQRSQQTSEQFWGAYFAAETENYKKILSAWETPFSGTLKELAQAFSMDAVTFCGFLDGINESLCGDQLVLDTLTEDTALILAVDYDKLYFNMLNAKADWLYNLPEWDAVRTPEQRHEILKGFRASKVFKAEQPVGRNDPCPCGSGKKYKKCCGK